MAVVFNSIKEYVESATTYAERIVKIDAAIDALLDKLLDTASNADLKEYSLDDGQTKIRATYSNAADVQTAINSLEKLKVIYQSRIQGRVVRLVDSKNFI